MESNNESNKDSFYADKLQKGYNYGAKVYMNGSNDTEDTPEKMKLRLGSYMEYLEGKYGGGQYCGTNPTVY